MAHTEIEDIGTKSPLPVVTLGGGTGNSILLRGLKHVFQEITTVVTVADDGGGSGVLREDLGMLPPGDIRSCLVALANAEPVMEKVMQYRFREGSLKGQCLGNLLLAAMADLYGGFDQGIKETAHVLSLTGKVLPMTLEDVKLLARLDDGTVIVGESNIPFMTRSHQSRIERVYLDPDPEPLAEAVDEIAKAKILIMGPGSLYTSLMPTLLVKKISDAIRKSAAKKYYIANMMTQPGETDGYSITDHVLAIENHCGGRIFDTILVNEANLSNAVKDDYLSENATPLSLGQEEREALEERGYRVLGGDFLEVEKGYVRHHALRLAQAILRDAER